MDHVLVMGGDIYKIEKHEMRRAADLYLRMNHPERRSLLTKRLLKETLIYLQGFAKALDYSVANPVLVSEMKELMLQEGVEYIVRETN